MILVCVVLVCEDLLMPDRAPTALIVFAGLPGVGKTTISRLVARRLGAALIRVDAIEAAVVTTGLATAPVGPVGYLIAHQIAAGCLAIGTSVVIDAVNPVPAARAGWLALAKEAAVHSLMVEVVLADEAEHRRRVGARRSDLPGMVVPSWTDVQSSDYQRWDVARDGERLVVDGAEPHPAVDAILAAIRG